MLISCKCLNVIINSNTIINQQSDVLKTKTSDEISSQLLALINNSGSGGGGGGSSIQATSTWCNSNIKKLFDELQKNSRSNKIHSECSDFLRKAIGPIQDLSINLQQPVLIYKVPIDQWVLHYCVNCNKITHAINSVAAGNSITPNAGSALINSNLLTNQEELNNLKLNKSFSNTFNILMIDHQPSTPMPLIGEQNIFQFNQHSDISGNNNKLKQQQLNKILQQYLQKEIDDTNERIRRYTEQQFSLLKNFREKTEQEYSILLNLINQVPEQLKLIDAMETKSTDISETSSSAIIDQQSQANSLFTVRQLSNLDTPPQTPESQPMSIGSSPTFRQQANGYGAGAQQKLQQQFNNTSVNDDSDCLFELEGVEPNYNYPSSNNRKQSNQMSDVEEAEDAEDALGELDSNGINFQRYGARRGSLNCAKSLPISITSQQMMANSRANGKLNYQDIEDEAITEDSTIDIAASIKALAKSVHGDTVFGDLPRPRFSTQI